MLHSNDTTVAIRPLRSQDIDDICKLHSSLLPIQYPPAYFRQCVLHPHKRTCLVAEASTSRSLVAFLSASLSDPGHQSPPVHELHILTLGVTPSHRRQGLATQLIHATLLTFQEQIVRRNPHSTKPAHAKLIAHTAVSNTPACQFYRKAMGPVVEEERVDGLYRKSIMESRDAYKFVGYISLGNRPAGYT